MRVAYCWKPTVRRPEVKERGFHNERESTVAALDGAHPRDVDVPTNIILQDNESSVLLETNGKASRGKRTRHMNIRYFGIADRVDKKEA
jgi:hypothetical protein